MVSCLKLFNKVCGFLFRQGPLGSEGKRKEENSIEIERRNEKQDESRVEKKRRQCFCGSLLNPLLMQVLS